MVVWWFIRVASQTDRSGEGWEEHPIVCFQQIAESSGKNIQNNKRTVTLIQPVLINVFLLLLNVIRTDIVIVSY